MDFGFAVAHVLHRGRSVRSFEPEYVSSGIRERPRTLVLFGDSHAMQWISAMRRAADAEGWRLLTLVKPGCAASDINPHNLAVPSDACKVWRARAIEKIIDLAPFAVVMASYNGATVRGDMLTSRLMPVDEVRSGTRSTLLKLNGSGIRVVVLRDSPLPPFNVPACISRTIGGTHSTADPCGFDASGRLMVRLRGGALGRRGSDRRVLPRFGRPHLPGCLVSRRPGWADRLPRRESPRRLLCRIACRRGGNAAIACLRCGSRCSVTDQATR